MASQFSVDPALEEICLIAVFLQDGWVVTVEDYNCGGRIHHGGDVVELERDGKDELAVILGWGETEERALQDAHEYWDRLLKWHVVNDPSEHGEPFLFYGHDLTQSGIFSSQATTQNTNHETQETEESEEEFSQVF